MLIQWDKGADEWLKGMPMAKGPFFFGGGGVTNNHEQLAKYSR